MRFHTGPAICGRFHSGLGVGGIGTDFFRLRICLFLGILPNKNCFRKYLIKFDQSPLIEFLDR